MVDANVLSAFLVEEDAVSIGYVCGDTIDKAYREYRAGRRSMAVAQAAADVLIWQGLASVAVPGLTINLVVSDHDGCVRALQEGLRIVVPVSSINVSAFS